MKKTTPKPQPVSGFHLWAAKMNNATGWMRPSYLSLIQNHYWPTDDATLLVTTTRKCALEAVTKAVAFASRADKVTMERTVIQLEYKGTIDA